MNLTFLVFITHNPTGSGKTSDWSSLVNIFKGHDFKMLPQVPFQQFCFICQGADKSLSWKQPTPLLPTIKSTHKLNQSQPTTEMLTASQGFPTVGTQKAAVIPLTKCRWREVKSVFVDAQKNGY